MMPELHPRLIFLKKQLGDERKKRHKSDKQLMDYKVLLQEKESWNQCDIIDSMI